MTPEEPAVITLLSNAILHVHAKSTHLFYRKVLVSDLGYCYGVKHRGIKTVEEEEERLYINGLRSRANLSGFDSPLLTYYLIKVLKPNRFYGIFIKVWRPLSPYNYLTNTSTHQRVTFTSLSIRV